MGALRLALSGDRDPQTHVTAEDEFHILEMYLDIG